MSKVITALTSPVGKKFLTGLTGLGLSIFVLLHLLGNLQLFIGGETFNHYTYKLESLGPVLYLLEIVLLAAFILHAIIGVNIYLRKKKARSVDYSVYNSAGAPSRQTSSSRSMIVTGTVLLIFTVIHVFTFKFGTRYETIIDGTPMRDLHRLVIEKFSDLKYVLGYVAVMILLGLHLRHGFWSAFQSMGAMNKKYRPAFYATGVVFAILISLGFLVLPIWIYFTGGAK